MSALKLFVPSAVCLLLVNVALGKPKKPDLPAVFENAKYVYVESVDGDILKPGLFPEDRQAISDVEDSLRQWKRYALTVTRSDADLVFVIRKGRLAAGQVHGGISGGSRPQPGSPQAGPTRGAEVGVRAEAGEPDDILRIYTQNEGELKMIVWDRSQEGGLDAPGVQLVQQLKAAVERAYPQTPPPPKKP